MTEIDQVGKEGCFQAATRRMRKRKHSELEENPPKTEKKSIFTTISEKLGFSKEPPRSALSQHSQNQHRGKLNFSFEHDEHAFVTNELESHEIHPKKRVKFDEENLIVSSITYQRQQAEVRKLAENRRRRVESGEKSMFSKFIDFTANLF
jgi:uncharacterized UBP type Zn finger protein